MSEARAELSALLVMVEGGEEVVIARGGKPVAKLVPIQKPCQPRRLGVLKGKIKVAEDFDKPFGEGIYF